MKFSTQKQKEEFVKKVQSNKGKLPDLHIVLKLLEKGMSQTEIALLYGVSRQSVSKLLNKK